MRSVRDRDRITEELAVRSANQLPAVGGTREAATEARNRALALLQRANSRVRHFYCSAGDDTDQTPELAKIGLQPRRDPGEAATPSPAAGPPEPPASPPA